MKLANLDGRAVVVTADGVIDVAAASGGRFPSSPDACVAHVAQIRHWLATDHPAKDPTVTRPRWRPTPHASDRP
ncbi:hypothetical protein [Streptomyces sp. XH2]|uniref:hypothetical protein n=1 Tax=Streptomyces sp. XH2 TaxID=3412483 RepID=UPI003C7CBFCD